MGGRVLGALGESLAGIVVVTEATAPDTGGTGDTTGPVPPEYMCEQLALRGEVCPCGWDWEVGAGTSLGLTAVKLLWLLTDECDTGTVGTVTVGDGCDVPVPRRL